MIRTVEKRFFRMLNRVVEPPIRAGLASSRLLPGGLIVLETKGRRTGRRSRVPLAALRIAGHTFVSTFRGRRSDWVRNLSASPEARYWLGGRPMSARAIVISSQRPDPKELPAALRCLLPFLAPYTCAGWAFALLVPSESGGSDAAVETA
ncbi:MAG: nitroreductase/quinone reductase family protein [Candidatus Binatia bacterium]